MITGITAAFIFIAAYVAIGTERVHKTLVAVLGAVAVILAGVLSQAEAFRAIDLNVILLLASMMVMANIIGKTGFFQWLAIHSARMARGEPVWILVLLSLVTAVASAFLPNVATVVLMVPLALFVAESLEISPKPFLISSIFAANIGGTATLIGDPPNTMIGSAAGLSFDAFLFNLAPIIVVILGLYLALAIFVFRKSLKTEEERKKLILQMDESAVITDAGLLRKSLIVMSITMAGFLVSGPLGIEPATISLGGAALILLWSRQSPEEMLREVDWAMLFFFIGLFILVAGIVKGGIIDALAAGILTVTGGHLGASSMIVIWLSAIASGVIDNIPYTAAMIPFIERLGEHIPAVPLWWSLALGTCLGGNLTAIAAAPNVYVVNIAKRSGHPITFVDFLRYGIPVTVGSVAVSSVYVWFRYLM